MAGGTSRNSTPPSELALCVFIALPAGLSSDIRAAGATPVTYTCLALPTARNVGAAPAPVTVVIPTSREAQVSNASAHAPSRLVGRVDIPCCLPPAAEPRCAPSKAGYTQTISPLIDPAAYLRAMARRHDHDAAGPAELLAAKAALRDEVWRAMSVKGIGRFPAPANRIPNFVGAEAAAGRLAEAHVWQRAATIKSNPDSPQLPVRVRALADGKLLYMAVPRLAEAEPFFVLDPETLADPPRKAASIKGAARSARTVSLDAMEPVDLVVTGCVAVGEDGARLGKGGGFSDLEFALAAAAGLVDALDRRGDDRARGAGAARGRDPHDDARHHRRPRRHAGADDHHPARAPARAAPRVARPLGREDRRHPIARAAAQLIAAIRYGRNASAVAQM